MKIIKSLGIIIAVMAIISGATWSYFSDEEKSVGNIFTAGALDLKVDSESRYNGIVCEGGLYEWDVPCETGATNLVSNGSFEEPVVTHAHKWDAYSSPVNGWTVKWMSSYPPYQGVNRPEPAKPELHNRVMAGWDPKVGNQYAELDTDWMGPDNPLDGEPASVKIYQDIPTVPGKNYKFHFYFSPRPDTGISENRMHILWDGNSVEILEGVGGPANVWQERNYSVTATKSLTRIEFQDVGTPNSMGTFLDDVEVRELVCPPSTNPELIAQRCAGNWEPTDLIPGTHKFFNFTDIKPGDYGEDSISLHVFNNDAWGRMLINNITDLDGTCVDPEAEAEGNECTDGTGELRENLNFWVWLDEGTNPGFQGTLNDTGEGDNIKQDYEIVLIAPGEIDLAGENYLLSDGLKAAYVAHSCTDPDGNTDYARCHGLATDGRMVESANYFFGIGWNLPPETGNVVQTDIFSADITFEVEQWRNNPIPFDAN